MGEVPFFLTRAAEGLDRRGFSMADIEKMIAAGILEADEKFELIDGEIVPMNPQAMPHLLMKGRLGGVLAAAVGGGLDVVQDATVVLARRSFFDADVLVFKANKAHRYIQPADVRLAVEVAESSRARDLFIKAPRYGAAGIPELWVVELNEEQTYVFRGPGTSAWPEPRCVSFDEPLAPLFAPALGIRLRDLL